ncbi:MAG: potassium transporter TrkG [Rhodoferax sp.]|uniref:TrkH family potassium uptake protein n=1 Tax=Rhodoferax sp. TaxID=50421 RepID=UPI0008AF15FC|nr:potassium transporter TrkG [Rhodoferax sp.]MDP2680735.1 potassium transporter TrkG [Rhodoferax sp.]OGB57427.1 MAG: potassium transporter Trk [Burkholderiales bacterium RIFOXYD12_FULL_59_19]OGB83561.1 MAG: potassium transporter Trk [Burkholderiales bacterium RIFOXYD2_FULL_59_8]
MSSLAPVFNILARIMVGYAALLLVPMAWAWQLDAPAMVDVWLYSMAITLVLGLTLWLLTSRFHRELMPRDGFLLVNLVWTVLPACSAIPLVLAIDGLSWTDAYFETMSGLTATGSTVISGLDALPVSVNVWRCFLQLIGGLGVILLVVAVLPLLGLGGVQLYKAETPGPMKDARLTPRIAETARGLWSVYFVFSTVCMLAYHQAGMSWADAFMHMCSTMGLGGFSSHDASFGFWNSRDIELVAIFFMALSGISFARYFIVWRSRSFRSMWRDTEVRAYVFVLLGSALGLAALLLFHGSVEQPLVALRTAAFHVVSIATTTGYAATDFSLWPVFAPVWMMFLGTFVSCAGSTGGGIKMVRMVLLIKQSRRELVRAIHPRVVNPVTLGHTTIPATMIAAVMAYMLIYGASTIGLTMLMLLTGLDITTAFFAIVATMNNIGIGLGDVGPAANFGVLTDFQTWICVVSMLLGRLELLAVIVLFVPQFWRK